MKYLALLLPLVVLFTGCTSKQYYEPDESKWFLDREITTTPTYIKTFNANGATTDHNQVLNKFGISQFTIPDGYEFLNHTQDDIMVANKNGELLFVDKNITLDLKNNVIAATKKESLIALVFSDNSIALYDLESKQFKLKKYAKQSFSNDIRIASPEFLDNLILFPTLDGRVILVNKTTFKVMKQLTVDPKNEINNIILLQTTDNIMVTASPNRLVVINNGKFLKQEFFIQSYLLDEGIIYIATLDGRIIKYDLELKELASKKFKFAKFQALAIDKEKNVYGIESAGYLVKLSNDFSKTTVYQFPFENDEMIYVNKSKIYFENKVIDLDK